MRQSKRGLPGKAFPSVDWKRLRGRRASPEARAAYHERRLELEVARSEEHTSELQSQSNLVCRLLLEKKKMKNNQASVTSTVSNRDVTSARSRRSRPSEEQYLVETVN